MPVHVLKERTYLDAEGKATADEGQAVSLLGIEDDEITHEQALAVGLTKKAAPAHEDEPAEMQYYDAAGKQVKAGSPDVASQYLSNDPNRPDAGEKSSKADKQTVKTAGDGDDDDGEAEAPAPTKKELLAKAEELGLEGFNARSKNDDISAAIAAAEKAE